jgi:dihydroorotate dehydrogenase
MYKILRALLFLFPTESVHYFSMDLLKGLCRWSPSRRLISWACRPETAHTPDSTAERSSSPVPALRTEAVTAESLTPTGQGLERTLLGLRFRNPVGLGAGFDKNARYLRELDALGFGFVEIGTVTPLPQAGNEKPRLFRLPEDQALINRMGFNNDGVEKIAERLKKWRAASLKAQTSNQKPETKNHPLIIGGNIGKNKATPNEEAYKDYEICFRGLYDYVDYFVVNVSSPNTPGLRELQEKDALRKILTRLQSINTELAHAGAMAPRPLLLKIAPDLSRPQLDDVIDLALEIGLDGLVATNTTVSRASLLSPATRLEAIGAGGLSGAPLRERATEVIRHIHKATDGALPLIASGGIFTGEDARERIGAGADLVQVWTGFIYEGPFITRRICGKL